VGSKDDGKVKLSYWSKAETKKNNEKKLENKNNNINQKKSLYDSP